MDDSVAVVNAVLEDVRAQLIRKDLEQHSAASGLADVDAVLAHLVLPISELVCDSGSARNVREILEIGAAIEFHILVAAFVLSEERSPELKTVALDPISELDSLLVDADPNALRHEVPQVEREVPSSPYLVDASAW